MANCNAVITFLSCLKNMVDSIRHGVQYGIVHGYESGSYKLTHACSASEAFSHLLGLLVTSLVEIDEVIRKQ